MVVVIGNSKYHLISSCMKSGNIILEFPEFGLYGQNQVTILHYHSICFPMSHSISGTQNE